MLRIGLTGGLASGKSTVAAILKDLGAAVFDADDLVRRLYEPGGAGSDAARDLFGDAVVDASGHVDRSRIAEIVFVDPAKRHALEAKIHPLVRAQRATLFAEARRKGAAVAVAEASQLLEAKTDGDYDRIVLVVAPQDRRIRRWEEKGGDPDDARRRISAQIAPSAAFDRADDVITNDGTLEELRRKVEALWLKWTQTKQPKKPSA